jgi:hypothetical protein
MTGVPRRGEALLCGVEGLLLVREEHMGGLLLFSEEQTPLIPAKQRKTTD